MTYSGDIPEVIQWVSVCRNNWVFIGPDVTLLTCIDLQVLLNQKEITGEEISFIIRNYPPHTPTSLILEERDPGSLPLFRRSQEEENEVEYNLLPE